MMLPQYITKANHVLEVIDAEPTHTWTKTQRELSEMLDISQPELSLLVKLLVDTEKIKKGAPLPGVRGRNSTLEVIDSEPLTYGTSRRIRPTQAKRPAPVLAAEEEVYGPIDLRTMSVEQIGAAVTRTLRDAWAKEDRHTELQSQQLTKIRELRELLTMERQTRQQLVLEKERLATENENLRHQAEEGRAEMAQIRAELNKVLISAKDRRSGGTFTVRESLDENEIKLLDALMRTKPGFYKESDAEVGLTD